MKIISHRGNLNGPKSCIENSHAAIRDAIALGFDVEIDLWIVDGKLKLGHDFPEFDENGLIEEFSDRLFCHAKHLEVIPYLQALGCHWFWHETDTITLTSKGIPWCFPGIEVPASIILDLEPQLLTALPDKNLNIYGICTDRPNEITKLL